WRSFWRNVMALRPIIGTNTITIITYIPKLAPESNPSVLAMCAFSFALRRNLWKVADAVTVQEPTMETRVLDPCSVHVFQHDIKVENAGGAILTFLIQLGD